MEDIPVYCPRCGETVMLTEELWGLCPCGCWLRVGLHIEARSDHPGEGDLDIGQITRAEDLIRG